MSKEHSGSEPRHAKGRQSRREFLKHMMLGGGAAVALVTTREVAAQPQTQPEAARKPETKGYHVTPHIEQYYRTADL